MNKRSPMAEQWNGKPRKGQGARKGPPWKVSFSSRQTQKQKKQGHSNTYKKWKPMNGRCIHMFGMTMATSNSTTTTHPTSTSTTPHYWNNYQTLHIRNKVQLQFDVLWIKPTLCTPFSRKNSWWPQAGCFKICKI